MDTHTQYWIDLAEYDLETARAMLEKSRYLYVGFMCHQSIEKLLKAFWQFTYKNLPPKTHNLAYLVQKIGLSDLPSEYIDFIDELDPLNIECRYPEYKDEIYKKMNCEYSQAILTKTQELFAWLKKRFY